MVRMGKHVHGLHSLDAIIGVEQRQVARLRSRVAAHVDDPLGRGTQDHPDDRFVDARTRRVEDDDVGAAATNSSQSTCFMSPA